MLLFSACSKNEQPLGSNEKASLITEQIISNSKCDAFRNELASPTMNDSSIDKVYDDAVKANCIHKDI